jgi:hypothetical protein
LVIDISFFKGADDGMVNLEVLGSIFREAEAIALIGGNFILWQIMHFLVEIFGIWYRGQEGGCSRPSYSARRLA